MQGKTRAQILAEQTEKVKVRAEELKNRLQGDNKND